MTAPQLLTIGQTAERLGFKTEQSVYNLIAAGRLRVVDIAINRGNGKTKSRIREDDLEEFIEKNTREPRAS